MRRIGGFAIMVGLLVAMPSVRASAHCDALDGPVVKAARAALETGDVAKVLPWVLPDHEGEVREAFDRARRVRAGGGEAQALADTWFFETLVRIHRAGEGAPFDGLKPAGSIDPLAAAVDGTLESGSVEALAERVTQHVATGVRERFARARETQTHAGDSIEAGRRFVAAYVEYMHYVEGIHRAAMGSAAHEAGATPAAGHPHP